jgi:hypothetical protein
MATQPVERAVGALKVKQQVCRLLVKVSDINHERVGIEMPHGVKQ